MKRPFQGKKKGWPGWVWEIALGIGMVLTLTLFLEKDGKPVSPYLPGTGIGLMILGLIGMAIREWRKRKKPGAKAKGNPVSAREWAGVFAKALGQGPGALPLSQAFDRAFQVHRPGQNGQSALEASLAKSEADSPLRSALALWKQAVIDNDWERAMAALERLTLSETQSLRLGPWAAFFFWVAALGLVGVSLLA